LRETFFRLAASGLVPRGLFAPKLPAAPPPPTGRTLELEVVSHCWRYHHLLAYQLSSFVLYPPSDVNVTVTVFHTPQDTGTVQLLDRIGRMSPRGIRWNWQALEPTRLFRRSLGRNLAARATTADWIWFTDCDLIFREGAADGAGRALSGREDFLLFPRTHFVTELLEPDDPLLQAGRDTTRLVDIDPARGFTPEVRTKATGAFQIVRGDVARAAGFCGTIPFYQEPVPRWRRTHDDRVFRWLLGTQGVPIDVPGLYRIRHSAKGRKARR
jgi:hypothetical protein